MILSRDSLDEYAAELLASGMATAYAVAVIDERGTLCERTYYRAFTGSGS